MISHRLGKIQQTAFQTSTKGDIVAESQLPKKILFLDRDKSTTNQLKDFLAKHQINVITADQHETAMYQFNQNRFDVAILESGNPDCPGLALIQKWRQHEVVEKRYTAFILICGKERTSGVDALAKELGDIELVQKPINNTQLLSILSRCYSTKLGLLSLQELDNRWSQLSVSKEKLPQVINEIKSKLPELGARGLGYLLNTYELNGQYAEALEIVQSALKNRPQDLSLMNHQGRLLLLLGKTSEAIATLDSADKVAPDNISRIEAMAEAYLELGKGEAALEKLRQLIKLNPEKKEYKFLAFERLLDNGFGDQAYRLGRETASPMEVVRYYNNKGVAESRAGSFEKALLSYEHALQFFPTFRENYRIHYNIAHALCNGKPDGWKEKAVLNLTKCIQLNDEFDKATELMTRIKKGSQVAG